jgi:hypothetical protein
VSRVHGRAPLPLPESLLTGLAGIGYRRVETGTPAPALFKHPKHRELFLEVTAPNVPGEAVVIAQWWRHAAARLPIDLLIAKLALQINLLASPVRPMERK